ncbi:MAG: twin-arginine translocase subunit TatC [Planctomycetota bacterium]
MSQTDEEEIEQSRMTLGDHLEELRSRLIKGLISVVVVFSVCWVYREQIGDIVILPMEQAIGWLNEFKTERLEEKLAAKPALDRADYFDSDGRLRDPIPLTAQTTGTGSGFVFYLKSTAYFALFIGGPVLLYQMWMFIAAGLYKTERRMVMAYMPASMLLFFGGVLFGYFAMVPYAIYFLNKDVVERFELQLRINEYFAFLSTLCLGLGVVFQLPIVMNAIVRAGIAESKDLARFRGYFVLLAFILAAILTPPDPFTQGMMAVPMILLYEVGLVTSRLGRRSDSGAAVESRA